MVRTRFAPSPTGHLHIGNVRSALFAYLFAKSKKGEFLLRIEDTDRERYVEDSVKTILDSLSWLGIKPDNKKPIYQSERLPVYKEAALKLIKEGKAYICTCSKERLEELRKDQEAKKQPPMYDRKCREAKNSASTVDELEEFLKKGAVVRMKMPTSGKIVINDLIRGTVEFDAGLIDDQVIIKSDGFPTYHMASVIDDHEMEISHVIRAEEWLSSTPKHITLYEMFGWKAPLFAHLPMILGPDKKKLSKRHGATNVMDYKAEGYLPEALVNFMAFLGWNPKDEREIFTMEELEKEFKLENVNKAPAVFDFDKLNSINETYLQSALTDLLAKHNFEINSFLADFGAENLQVSEAQLLSRGGYKTLKEMAEAINKLRKEPDYDSNLLVFKKSTKENSIKGLEKALEALSELDEKDWISQELQIKLNFVVTRNDLTNGDVFWPVRVALSGEEKSPSPVELLIALGKDESIKRIKKAVRKLT